MALVRHFVRSTVCLRAVLRHTDITRHLNCSVKRIEQQLLCAPALQSWSVFRTYATKKSKGQKKEKETKLKAAKLDVSEEDIHGIIDSNKLKEEYHAIVENLKHEYIHNLALRSSTGNIIGPGSFDNLMIETGDGTFPLNQLAQIVQKNPSLLVINLATMPQYIGSVVEALRSSGMNINPQQEGTHTIYVPIPKISREHRETLAKSAKTLYMQTKEKLNGVNGKYSKKINKKENQNHHGRDLLEKLTKMVLEQMHLYNLEAENLMKAKVKELLGEH